MITTVPPLVLVLFDPLATADPTVAATDTAPLPPNTESLTKRTSPASYPDPGLIMSADKSSPTVPIPIERIAPVPSPLPEGTYVNPYPTASPAAS